jgi:hypothetical protein
MPDERKEQLAIKLVHRAGDEELLSSIFDDMWPQVPAQVAQTLGIPLAKAELLVGRTLPPDIKERWMGRVKEKQVEVLSESMSEDDLFKTVQFFESTAGKAYLRTSSLLSGALIAVAADATRDIVAYTKSKLENTRRGE